MILIHAFCFVLEIYRLLKKRKEKEKEDVILIGKIKFLFCF